MFWRRPLRLFTVHGQIGTYVAGDRAYTQGSVTLRAKSHDAAEAEARAAFHLGDEWFADRWFRVDRVVEHRGR